MRIINYLYIFLLGTILSGCSVRTLSPGFVNLKRCNSDKLFAWIIDEARNTHRLSYYDYDEAVFFVQEVEGGVLFSVSERSSVNQFIAFFNVSIKSYCVYEQTYFLFVGGKYSQDGIEVEADGIIDKSEVASLYKAYNYAKFGTPPSLEIPVPNLNPFSYLFKKSGKEYLLIDQGTNLIPFDP